jgi:hypothetical protein
MDKITDRPVRHTIRASNAYIEIMDALIKLPQHKFHSRSDLQHILLKNYANIVLDKRDWGAVIDNII